MVAVHVILPAKGTRGWHSVLVDRLNKAGHDVQVAIAENGGFRHRTLDAILAIERRIFASTSSSLSTPVAALKPTTADRHSDLIINLSEVGVQSGGAAPTLSVLFDGRPDLSAAAAALCQGAVPVIDLSLDGIPVRHAAPMADSRAFISRGLNDVLARAITLIADFVDRYEPRDSSHPAWSRSHAASPGSATGLTIARRYRASALPRLALRFVHHRRYYADHWRVGYRFLDGPGVVEKGSLAGTPWAILPDAGDRFYADPFPFEWQGRYFIFVEELVHSVARGVISVSECGPDGRFSVPRPVLEERFHLSYPQVFARNGQLWMIPETGAGKKVALYRARRFPDDWVEQQLLIAGRAIFDATLLDHNGLLWLFGTERDGAGSASDTLVVFFSERMEGPWQPHPMNPVLIDKSAARPGGGFAKVGKRIMLPIQDGTRRYGGGLGISQLLRLDPQRVELSKPVPIDSNGHWPYPQIHTLNRHGRLETIDGLAQVPRFKAR